jgi:hypothetical protein
MNLLTAIIICRKMGRNPLDVWKSGSQHFWDPFGDEGWLQYKKALEVIYLKSRILYKALSWFKVI